VVTAPNPSVSPSLWQALRSATAPASIAELQRSTPGRHHHIKSRLRAWADAGLVEPLPPVAVRFAIARHHAKLDEAPTPGLLSADAWRALRRAGRPATLAELVAATGAGDRPLYCRLFRWIRSGHLTRVEPEPERFMLTPCGRETDGPPTLHRHKPRKIAVGRDRIWAAMRVLKQFDVPMLMMTAEASRRACEDFIASLGAAGYVRTVTHRVVRRKAGNHGFARGYSTYQLIRSTGPKRPVISCPTEGGKFLFDRNSGQRVEMVARQRREVNHVR
jgi:hypothetical protein